MHPPLRRLARELSRVRYSADSGTVRDLIRAYFVDHDLYGPASVLHPDTYVPGSLRNGVLADALDESGHDPVLAERVRSGKYGLDWHFKNPYDAEKATPVRGATRAALNSSDLELHDATLYSFMNHRGSPPTEFTDHEDRLNRDTLTQLAHDWRQFKSRLAEIHPGTSPVLPGAIRTETHFSIALALARVRDGTLSEFPRDRWGSSAPYLTQAARELGPLSLYEHPDGTISHEAPT